MYLEAELALAFDRPTERVRVPAPGWGGRVMHLLTLGRTSEVWERESFETSEMTAQLAQALRAANIDNVVSVSADDELIFLDERRRDHDLSEALDELTGRSAGRPEWPARLEVVAEHQDDIATYVIQLLADRVHPLDRPPLRLRAYALLRRFDLATSDTGSYRGTAPQETQLRDRMVAALASAAAHAGVVNTARDAMVAVAGRLETALRGALGTHPSEAAVRCCIMRPRRYVSYADAALPLELDRMPPFRGYPGMREATYYLRLWLPLLRSAQATVQRTLFVDEGGRPVFHIQDEALDVASTDATLPGGDITAPLGVADAAFFAGNDYEERLRMAAAFPVGEPAAGDAAWEAIRLREIGYAHTKMGAFANGIDGGGGGLSIVGYHEGVDIGGMIS